MKKFIGTVLKFIVPFSMALLLLNGLLKITVNHYCNYKVDPKIQTIILGNSQPEHAFNDSLIANTKNFSTGGETYVYTYQKLKKLTQANPQIKRVLVCFSTVQIQEIMNDWTFSKNNMNAFYAKFSFVMDQQDYAIFANKSLSNLMDAEVKGMVVNAKATLKKADRIKNNDFGGYLFSKRAVVDSLLATDYIQKIKRKSKGTISEINIYYLKKIVSFCEEKNIQIVFFRTPMQSEYIKIQPEKRFQQIRLANFKSVPFIDLIHFPISNQEYADFIHLNYKGARKISTYLNTLLHSNTSLNNNKIPTL